MFIKKLELYGFKTFADKTEVEFSNGTTAVVGPNGCGKTNVADALLWVLGESNVRNLRGRLSTDVIFNGTEKRKGLGMAEVSLTLDNACGTLPISFAEVTITRRAFRSGESEFFINKSRCRLKDIYELFLDTGIGREAYSTVTQGEIDAVLSAKSEDRRELFEEAAGIKKYRYRRHEALKKLEKTEGNLNRVRDIMAELEDQIEPLAEQAEQAKQYLEYQNQLKQIEVGLLVRDLKKYNEQLIFVRDSKKDADEKLIDFETKLADLEVKRISQFESMSQLEEQLEDARRFEQNASANVSRLTNKLSITQEKINSAKAVKNQSEAEINSLKQKIGETSAKIREIESQMGQCESSESEIHFLVNEQNNKLEELENKLQQANQIINDQKASYLELAKELATKRNALQNSQTRISQLETAINKYSLELKNIGSQKEAAQSKLTENQNKQNEVEKDIQSRSSELTKLNENRKSEEKNAAELAAKLTELNREIASKSSRLATLKEMAESHEGFFEGVRNVMSAVKSGKIKGGFAVIADIINVPKGYETAIETALGASLQDIVSDSVEQAKSAIAFLKENRAGRATFLPLDSLNVSNTEIRGINVKDNGFLGAASEIVEYDNKYELAVKSLLARTVIVENIDDAVYFSKKLSGWNKIVTLDGEIIVPSGAITGGTIKSKTTGILLRKQEIESLAQELKTLDSIIGNIKKDQQANQEKIENLRKETASVDKLLSDLRISFADLKRQVDFTNQEVKRIQRQFDTIELEKDEAEILRNQQLEESQKLENELSKADKADIELDKTVSEAEHSLETLSKERDAARERLMQMKVDLAGSTERSSALANMLNQMKSSLSDIEASKVQREKSFDNSDREISAMSVEIGALEREVSVQTDLHSAAKANLEKLIAKRTEDNSVLSNTDSEIKNITNARNQLIQNTHDADVKEARLEIQVNQSAERLMEEYEMSAEYALSMSDSEIEIERGTASEVARLRREIKFMGEVNTGAVSEYDRIKQRWDFLTDQKADLEEASDQIKAAIRDIDTSTRDLFIDTFNLVASNFDEIFKRLFGGGKTQLSLTEPNNLLETGIDVVVQPPGKKMQDMALLSGGERALTATALIFALLRAKPSPFVVMDEVDAPLDESNVERFADVLRDFAQKSQFIVITHNRATMEAADCLYGVTMEEPGVSKLISVKLTASREEDPLEELAAI